MKTAKTRIRRTQPQQSFMMIMDEMPMPSPSPEMQRLFQMSRSAPSSDARHYVAVQVMMKFNSGKRIKFFSSLRWSDTMMPVKPARRKFFPSQVTRKIKAIQLQENK